MLLFTTEQIGYSETETHHLTTLALGLNGSLRWSGCLHGCERCPSAESPEMWGENSSCQDSASLYIWHRVGMKNERATGTGSTTKSSETEKMQMCRKGRRHGMSMWKNVLLGTSWWTCWVCPMLCTSARVSRLPQRDAHRVHRHQQVSPAVPQIG